MSVKRAFRDIECGDCGGEISEGDPIYFSEGMKICEGCAEEYEIVCPDCGGQKKSDFGKCYDCNQQNTSGLELSIGDDPIVIR